MVLLSWTFAIVQSIEIWIGTSMFKVKGKPHWFYVVKQARRQLKVLPHLANFLPSGLSSASSTYDELTNTLLGTVFNTSEIWQNVTEQFNKDDEISQL